MLEWSDCLLTPNYAPLGVQENIPLLSHNFLIHRNKPFTRHGTH